MKYEFIIFVLTVFLSGCATNSSNQHPTEIAKRARRGAFVPPSTVSLPLQRIPQSSRMPRLPARSAAHSVLPCVASNSVHFATHRQYRQNGPNPKITAIATPATQFCITVLLSPAYGTRHGLTRVSKSAIRASFSAMVRTSARLAASILMYSLRRL